MITDITPDREKAKSILKMIKQTKEFVETINKEKFSSIYIKEYYDIIREEISVICLLDGKKAEGEYAHKELIDHISLYYNILNDADISFCDRLRIVRNRINYDGFFVEYDYILKNEQKIKKIDEKLFDKINTLLNTENKKINISSSSNKKEDRKNEKPNFKN